ncbi:phytanoyl-CoA dioxygenase [Gonapodya prolifera JEL478]|uniref:Phytanoyl-CoA dioxygenase n=1 Tax=Gonapodya prolifera (strain JEL478) TaxID=1344416 RepID=A0A139B0L9_GONPJ|nr:phytanoyl-CoA dioxygenase [Gonapodya prolifera JEL478]|eukprot:KXS22524.1 phytanoyl-CoA dioxygenase [Gonapodya prolifera JEL478]
MTAGPQIRHLPASATIADIRAALDEDGACIVDNLVSRETADQLLAEATPFFDKVTASENDFAGKNTQRVGAVVARFPTARTLIGNETVLGTVESVLLPHCEKVQLHTAQIIGIAPPSPAQPLHRDQAVWGEINLGFEPEVSVIWALVDFTLENGCTRVVPKSHTWDYSRNVRDEEIAFAEMDKGSCLFYTGSAVHSGGMNSSDHTRYAMVVSYSLGWLRQEENQYLSCPPDIARTLEPRIYELLGYTVGAPLLGYYSDPRVPAATVDGKIIESGLGPDVLLPEQALGKRPRDKMKELHTYQEATA